MAIFVIELEGSDAEQALAEGKRFLAGDSLLQKVAEMANLPIASIPLKPSDVTAEYGSYSTAQLAAITTQVLAEVTSMGGLPDGFELDEVAPAWVILTAPGIDADNMTYRLRKDGTFEPVAVGVTV